MAFSMYVFQDSSVRVLEYPEITSPEQGLKESKLDRGSIRSSPRNGIGSTSKKNMEFWSLVTESFLPLT